ncbi:anaphase-promoting complex subunit 1 [Anopheles stephensi]|uniref:anaphase-promoting complex subunit 1 n=1 Tax=Anopheles stephensi TaxID=30069 RepID=UPI001658934A|nr:anaphase-promoting complex subunit 1 [Anopheles stephensi]
MITATEPLEYFPRGRQVVENHPGPNVEDEHRTLGGHPVDFVLLQRMQNVNISLDEDEPAEFYRLREQPIQTDRSGVSPAYIGMEEELYVLGHTAVWTRCMSNETQALPQTTFTCDSPIRFAFFCPRRFIRPDTTPASKPDTGKSAICLIDKDTLHVFLEGGETYRAMLQCPVSAVWMVPDGIMLERNATHSVTICREEGVPWPRLFTLTFPLEEMKPVLLATGTKYGFLDSPNYRVVFSSEKVSLVLVYGELSGKHYVYRLRPACDEEIEAVRYMDQTDDSELENDQSVPGTPDEAHASTQNIDQRHTLTKVLGATTNLEHTFGVSSALSSWIHSFPLGNNPFGDQPTRCGEDFMSGLDRNCNGREQLEQRSASLAPQFSLEYVMTVNGVSISMWSSEDGEMASEAFLHTDLVGNNYICFLQSRACRLTLLHYEENSLSVSCTHMLLARSAVSLDHINMIVVLEPTGRLVLYSGPIAVGKLHVTGLQSDCFRTNPVTGTGGQPTVKLPSFVPTRTNTTASTTQSTCSMVEGFPRRSTLLPNVSGADGKFDEELHLLSPVRPISLSGPSGAIGSRGPYSSAPTNAARSGAADAGTIVKLRDATGSRFTLVLGNERHVRLALAPVAESQLVRNCVKVMRLVLPAATVHEFLIHWYNTRNVPGSHAGFSTHQEWDLFRTLLFTMMGRPIGPPDADDRASAAGVHQPAGSAGGCMCADEPKKRRRGENSHGQAADWEFLVGHATDQPYEASVSVCPEATTGGGGGGGGARPYQNRELQSLYPYIPDILQTFHLLYEDLKMNVCRTDDLRLLADFLYCLAADAKLDAYQMHYRTDFPELFDRYRRHCSCVITDSTILNRLGGIGVHPPRMFRYIERLLLGDNDGSTPFCYRPGINDFSYDMCALVAFIYRIRVAHGWVRSHLESVLSGEFFDQQTKRPLCIQHPATAGSVQNHHNFERTADTVLAFLVERGYTRTQLDQLPIAMRYVILNYLEGCREYLTHGLQAVFYELLMRPELRAHSISSGLQDWVPDVELNAADDLQERDISQPKFDEIDSWQKEMSEIEICGTGNTGGVAGGVAAGGGGGGSVGVSGGGTASSSQKEDTLRQGCDEDGMGGLDDELLQLRFPDDRRMHDVRTFLNSSQRIQINIPHPPNVPDHEFLEEQERRLYMLCLRTMALPIGRGMFTVSSSRPSETQTVPVPRLCLSGRDVVRGTTIEIQQIEVPANMSLWPSFHNGVAAGLRICPDTPHLTSTWITNNRQGARNSSMLPPGTDTSTEHGGFLMALGLTGHLRKLSIYSIFDYMVRSDEMVRLGLLLGLSAAYRGTGDLATTRLLAVHVEALLPPTSVELDVSQNLQIAALLGVGLLYQGTAKRHMVEILLQEIGRPPGPEMENYVERESYSLTAGLALGLVTLGLGDSSSSLHDLALPDTLYYYMNGGNRRMMVGAQKEKYRLPSFQIKEGPAVNLDVTAPGATLALGLMYFATGNEAISRLLEPPTTVYILQFVRPDLLQLRIVARHLIHWERIEATSSWVEQQIPELLRQNISPLEEEDVPMDEPAGDDPEHGTGAAAHESNLSKVDQVLYSQAYCSVMCGSAIAIGLRFAGTADATAVKTLDHYLLYFIEQGNRLNKSAPERPSKFARSVGRQVIENCSMVLLLSLSLVLAGTGDLRVLRAVRMLRSRIGVLQVTYGSHMAIHMALGFLFLGAGRYTLSRTPTAVAALVCSIFPKFPTYSNDNRYHLQAFRHLYVLAIEPRIFIPRRIDTGRLCLCRIRYALLGKETAPVEQFAPCLLPELDTLAWIEVCDENFWPFRFDRRHNWQILESIFKTNERVDVKQRTGCLTYQEDPTRLITNQINPVSYNHSLWQLEPLNLLQFVGQPEVINITRMLLIPPSTRKLRCLLEPIGAAEHENAYMKLYAHHVTDCVFDDRLHALPIYLGLTQILQDDPRTMHKSLDAWQLRLLTAALDKCDWPCKIPGARGLLSVSLLQSLLKRIWKRCDEQFHRYKPIVHQYLNLHTINDPSEGLIRGGSFGDCPMEPADESNPERRREHLLNLVKLIVLYDLPYGTLPSGGVEVAGRM